MKVCDRTAPLVAFPHHIRPASIWQRQRLARRLVSIDQGHRFACQRLPTGLFDFQAAAIQWLQARNECGEGYSLLEMGSGCGKTKVVAHFLRECSPADGLCLYVTLGGLVRQTHAELAQVLPCARAESTREFVKLLRNHNTRVIVVNAAISKTWLPCAASAWSVVVDEVHRSSSLFLNRLANAVMPSCKLLFVTATPSAKGPTAALALLASDEQHFVFLKHAGALQALRMPTVYMRSVENGLPLEPDTGFLESYRKGWEAGSTSRTTPFLLSLTLATWEDTAASWEAAARAWVQLQSGARPPADLSENARLRLRHPALRRGLQLMCSAGSPFLTAEALGALRRTAALPSGPGRRREGREICACCALQEEEVQLMSAVRERELPPPTCPMPHEWDFSGSPFVRALLRFSSSSHVSAYRARVARSPARGPRCIWLTSDLSAAQRAQRVQCFSRSHEDRAALAFLRCRGFGASPAAAQLRNIGDGALLRNIIAHIADECILVCDARCGDVGYNLQFVTHVLSPGVPRNTEEVHQLVGRAERISRRGGRKVQLLCMCRPRTGEAFLIGHLQHALAQMKINNPPLSGPD